jgi:hypothetical protein
VDDGSFPKANLSERSTRIIELISERDNAIVIEAMSLLTDYDESGDPGTDGVNQISLDDFICADQHINLRNTGPDTIAATRALFSILSPNRR